MDIGDSCRSELATEEVRLVGRLLAARGKAHEWAFPQVQITYNGRELADRKLSSSGRLDVTELAPGSRLRATFSLDFGDDSDASGYVVLGAQ
jgi:hypothetical protein